MKNSYRYIDPDYVYTNPTTGILRNLAELDVYDTLVFAETAATTKRSSELLDTPIIVRSSAALLDIHHYLFQDINAWAGKTRTVEISKSGKQFFPTSRFVEERT